MFGKSVFFAWSSILALSAAATPEAPDGPDSFLDQRPAALRGSAEQPYPAVLVDDAGEQFDYVCPPTAAGGDGVLRTRRVCKAGDLAVVDAGEWREVLETGNDVVIWRAGGVGIAANARPPMKEIFWKCGGEKQKPVEVFGSQLGSQEPVTRVWVRYHGSRVCWYW